MKQVTLKDKTFELFIPYSEIHESVVKLAERIDKDYSVEGKEPPVFLGVLNGAFMFMAELMRELKVDCEVSFVKLASYEGTESTGRVSELIGITSSLEGRDVIVVEDIVDTGTSVDYIIKALEEHKPASVEIATMLFKPNSYAQDIEIKYSALSIPNDFIVGFGLDYDQIGRNLPHIYKIVEE